jgi:hypothetical protein
MEKGGLMRKISFLLVFLVLLVVACGRARTPAVPADTPPPTASTVTQSTTTPSPTPTPAAPSVPTAIPEVPAAAAALSLAVTAPQDEVVVKDAVLQIVGRTSPDAIVSVNGRIVRTMDIEGNFSTLVSLLEGPNRLEVIATDYRGEQASQVLTVIYAP